MTEVIKAEDCGENIGDYDVQIYNAILIPENATNGDMVKAMFPNCQKLKVLTDKKEVVVLELKDIKKWWNTPYKQGVTG